MYDIKRPEIWFFQTITELSESGVPRLRMLPNQYVPDPSSAGSFLPCKPELNTQSELKPRQVNPVGTVFASKFLEIKTSTKGTPFYNTKKSTTSSDLISMAGGVSADISDAYREYMSQCSGVAAYEKMEEEVSKKSSASGPSTIDRLLKENPMPTGSKDNFYVEKDTWIQLLFNIHRGYNTMLVGDSGTGKTELAMLIGKRMEKAVKVFDMAAKQDPIASLIGVHRFDGGKSIFDRADFTYAVESNGIIVLDELPRAPLNTNNILFPVLDSRRELNMDVAEYGLRTLKVNPDCRFIATANEGYEYTGNTVLDRALKERFQIVQVGYMPEKQEVELLVNRTSVDKLFAEVIVRVGRKIRDMHRAEDISSGISIRHTLYAADLTAGGLGVSKAMEASFLPMFIIEDEIKKIKDLLTSR